MMNERELTRLSFLVDALVSAPTLNERLVGDMLATNPPRDLAEAVEALRAAFTSELKTATVVNLELCRRVSVALLNSPEWTARIAGRALARAVENVSRS